MRDCMRISCLHCQHFCCLDSFALGDNRHPMWLWAHARTFYAHFSYMKPKEYQIHFVSTPCHIFPLFYSSSDSDPVECNAYRTCAFYFYIHSAKKTAEWDSNKHENTLCRIHNPHVPQCLYIYVCVSINDIIRDNRTGSQSFSAWILHLFKQKKKIRESPLFFFLCCPFVNSVHLYFGRVNVWFERNKNMIWAAATPRSWKEFDTSDHKWCIYHLIGVYAQSKACTIMNKLAPNICIGRGTAHSIEDLKRRSFLCWWWISSFSSLFNDLRV